jgi:hypothetical protein
MDDSSILGGALNQLGQSVKKVGQQIVKLPVDMSKDLGEQIGLRSSSTTVLDKNLDNSSQNQQSGWKSDEERVQFLRGLYGADKNTAVEKGPANEKTEAKNKTSANPLAKAEENKAPSEFQKQIADFTPEEQKKIIELRNQLHKENYYDPTFNPKNPPAGGEERPAEKVENEKKQEMMELQKKEGKKPPPLAVVREQNKAEQFRGAAGKFARQPRISDDARL